MGQFVYSASIGEDHIRILELLPGETKDVLKCNVTVELRRQTEGSYDAISYVWGEGEDVEIICCQRTMRITTNLADALRTIRSKNPGKSVRLWADAISIDQNNPEEKNHQVKRMGLVYENARQVHVCLGRDDNNFAQNLFALIQKWIHLLHDYKEPSKVPRTVASGDLCKDPHRGSKLAELLGRPWFSRVWVIQEVALSKSAQLHWGDAVMDFADLVELACFYDGRSNIANLIGGHSKALKFLHLLFLCAYRTYGKTESWGTDEPYYFKTLRKKYQSGSRDDGLLLDILLIGKSRSATDSRDHIFSFGGNPLALDSAGKMLVEPNYYKSEEEINLELAGALLKLPAEAPFILCFVQHCSAEEITGSRGPSWVPRWSCDTPDRSPKFTIGNIGHEQKAGGSVDKIRYQILDNRFLVLQGLVFDQLRWTSDILESESFTLDSSRYNDSLQAAQHPYVELLWEEVSLAFEDCLGPLQHLDRDRYENDFSFTLVKGYGGKRSMSRESHVSVFRAYRSALERKCNSESIVQVPVVSKKKEEKAGRFEKETAYCSGRRFGITKSGRFALIPEFAQEGDICAIFLGMSTPFVLRPSEVQPYGEACYHLVGEAYVHGVMRGELASDFIDKKVEMVLI